MQVTHVEDHITHAVVSPGKVQSFSVAQTAEFFKVLSSSLYSDKMLAVVRETMCNAWDAHIEAGITNKPIEIELDHERLIIRDFGPGIARDQIQPTYGVYGGSTKVANENVTGGFGLGCKAPFAYNDHFEVVSCHQGTKTIYRMSLSSAMVGGLPSITEIVSVPTDETGLTVTIDLKSRSDRARFSQLVYMIAKLGEMRVQHEGNLIEGYPFSKGIDGYLLMPQQKLNEIDASNQIFVRYGNVVYPVAPANNYRQQLTEVWAILNKIGGSNHQWDATNTSWAVVFQAPPHSISVTPSRESLSLTDHTIKTITELLDNFIKKMDLKKLIPIYKMFIKEAVDQTYLVSTPEVLFTFGNRIPNMECAPGKNPDFIWDLYGVAEYQLRTRYPKNIQNIDFLCRLNVLAENNFGRPGLANSLRAAFLKQQRYYQTRAKKQLKDSNWFHKKCVWPIIQGMKAKGLDYKRLFVVSSSSFVDRPMPAVKFCSMDLKEYLPFLRNIVVLAHNRFDLDRAAAFPILKHWLGPIRRGALFYTVARGRKADQAREYFQNLDVTLIDLTVRHAWEGETVLAPVPKPVAPTKKRPKGLPKLSACNRGSFFSVHKAYEKDTDRIEDPEFYIVLSPRKDDINSFAHFSEDSSAAIMRLFGTRGGIARNLDHAAKYIHAGAIEVREYVAIKMLEEMKSNPKLKQYFECSLNHREKPENPLDYDKEGIFNAIMQDSKLVHKFGIPNNITQRERDFFTIWSSYSYYQFRDEPLKEAFELMKTWKVHPKIKELVDKINKSELIMLIKASQFERVFLGSPTPEKLEQQKKAREILLTCLKG